MTSDAEPAQPAAPPKSDQAAAAAAAGALVLLIAADWLFWDEPVGISLAVFAVLLAGAVGAAAPMPADHGRRIHAAVILVLAIVPVIELAQTLSVLFLAGGLIAFTLTWTGRLQAPGLRFLLGFPVVGPVWLIHDFEAAAARAGSAVRPGTLLSWVLPGLLGLVFLLLFSAANPVIEGWAEAVLSIEIFDSPWRVAFWAVELLAVWPFLRLAARAAPGPLAGRLGRIARPGLGGALVSPSSATGALVLFNAIFAVETVLDLIYLWGGAALPDGMTYATYAHRGAYPLVATALMAGGFVIFATSVLRPTPLMLRLIHLWIVQNLLLLVSAVLRLTLYVEVYALTHLRVAAFIWMGLVALGFVLLVVRLVLGKDNRWLVTRNLITGLAVLYACCFFNFADLIARCNLAHSRLVIGAWKTFDDEYVCRLGTYALPAIVEYEAANHSLLCLDSDSEYNWRPYYRPGRTWRAWGLRDWRLERRLVELGYLHLP